MMLNIFSYIYSLELPFLWNICLMVSFSNFLLDCWSLWNRFAEFIYLFVFCILIFLYTNICCKNLILVCIQVGHEVSWRGNVSSKGISYYLAWAWCCHGNVDPVWLGLSAKNKIFMQNPSVCKCCLDVLFSVKWTNGPRQSPEETWHRFLLLEMPRIWVFLGGGKQHLCWVLGANVWSYCVYVQSLSHFWLFATPWTLAAQAPLSMGFPRQEYWRWLPFPSPGTSWPGGWTWVSCLAGRFFTIWAIGKSFWRC